MNSETTKPDRERGADDRSPDEESAPAFKVIDRRRFAADGSERPAEEVEAEDTRGAERPSLGHGAGGQDRPRPAAAPSGSSPIGPAPHASAVTHENAGMPVGEAYGDDRSIPTEPTFATLIISLSTQALMLLGEIVEPGQEAPSRDLPSAKHMIDLLAVLEKKTAGNLDATEAALLERILYDLRMRFVELARSK
jgi:Domain of unknown function (DUF1844)